jgi:ParB family chromosome partitioning protein
MATTRSTLDRVSSHLDESLGIRAGDSRPRLSPVPSAKDIGRRPASGFGRVEITQIIADTAQPRTAFDTGSLSLLAENLRAKGQLHPIHVRWSDDVQKWVIISGERRWRAAQQAGLTGVDCYFHEEPLTPGQVLELQLIENLLRTDLKPLEQARAFQSLQELNGWTGKQVAQALHIPESQVSRALALLKLPADIQQQVDAGDIPARTAYELTKLPDDQTRRRLAQQAASGRLTQAAAAQTARRRRRKPRSRAHGIKQTFYADAGWTITVTSRQAGTYHHIVQALFQALDEVRLRIANNIRL